MEKAFAKYHGNYTHLAGGIPSDAIRSLNNSPMMDIYHKRTEGYDLETMWTFLSDHMFEGHIV